MFDALPFFQCKSIPYESLIQYECSDRLIIAKNIQDSQGLDHTPCILQITNSLDISVVGTVYNVHSENDIIYMPTWMMATLKTTQNCTIACVPVRACTSAVIKPYNTGLFEIKDWHIKLCNGLRLYSTLTQGNTITIDIDGAIYFTVEMLHPETSKTIYVPASGHMEIDIRASFEAEYTTKKQEESKESKESKEIGSEMKKTLADYSQIPYLAIIPYKIREQLRYEAINIFGGRAYRLADSQQIPVKAAVAAGEAAIRRKTSTGSSQPLTTSAISHPNAFQHP
jgi:hypothetical protein